MNISECKAGMRVSKTLYGASCYGTILRLSCEPVQPVVKWDHVPTVQYISASRLSPVKECRVTPELIVRDTVEAFAKTTA